MDFIANALLLASTSAAAIYCYVLSRRIKGLTDLDTGLGGAISALSRQVDEMKTSVDAARRVSGASAKELVAMTARAEIAAGRLELLLATLHERSEVEEKPKPRRKPAKSRRAG